MKFLTLVAPERTQDIRQRGAVAPGRLGSDR